MTWHRISLAGVALLLLGLLLGLTRIWDLSSTDDRISDTTIAAYQKLGASYYKGADAYVGNEMRYWGSPEEEYGELGVVGFSFSIFPKEKLPWVAVPFALALEGADVTDDDLKRIGELKNLKSLHLGRTKVTDAGMKHLATLENLSWLSLAETQVTDKGLKELAPLAKLTTLHVTPTDANFRVLREIGLLHAHYLTNEIRGTRPKSAEEVTSLTLGDLRARNGRMITEAGLREIVVFKNLISLDLASTHVTDTGLRELASLKHLRKLNLGCTEVTDEGLKELIPLKNLRELGLWYTKVTPNGLKGLAGLNLHSLRINHQLITDSGLGALREIGLLHAFDGAEGENHARPTTANEVVSFEVSAFLDRNDSPNVTDAGLKELTCFNNLAKLRLRDTQVTGTGLKELIALKNLTALDLTRSKVTDAGLKELVGFKQLTSLNLEETRVTDAGLRELVGLKQLTWLDLSGTDMTDAGLKELKGFNQLTKLYLYHTKVTDDGVNELGKTLPNCSIKNR